MITASPAKFRVNGLTAKARSWKAGETNHEIHERSFSEFNHRWTQMNTDVEQEGTEGTEGPPHFGFATSDFGLGK
jgi:hypothetical protein